MIEIIIAVVGTIVSIISLFTGAMIFKKSECNNNSCFDINTTKNK